MLMQRRTDYAILKEDGYTAAQEALQGFIVVGLAMICFLLGVFLAGALSLRMAVNWKCLLRDPKVYYAQALFGPLAIYYLLLACPWFVTNLAVNWLLGTGIGNEIAWILNSLLSVPGVWEAYSFIDWIL